MINLHIKNFKCFIEKTIDLNQLTLLVGANGVGKSTVIQALLLLRNTFESVPRQRVVLNTTNLMLGTADAVLCQSAEEPSICLSLKKEDHEEDRIECCYTVGTEETQLDLGIESFSCQGSTVMTTPYFYYLCAERLGPRISQPLHCLPYMNVGANGQYTAQVLSHQGGMLKVEEERMVEGSKNRNLQAQVNGWLLKILPGIHITATQDVNSLQAQIKIDHHAGTIPMLAPNIGFGISYVLPILTAGLTVEKGSLFIVENPEAHLHPAAQSAIGEFLGMVALGGVHVVIETHSDHVVNGVQLFVAAHKDFHDKVTIHNFSSKPGEVQPSIDSLRMNEDGELSDWPAGFFDQAQIDYMKLQRLKRRHV